jgi:hypothetical protein
MLKIEPRPVPVKLQPKSACSLSPICGYGAFALGTLSSRLELEGFLKGTLRPSRHEYNLIAVALNEYLIDRRESVRPILRGRRALPHSSRRDLLRAGRTASASSTRSIALRKRRSCSRTRGGSDAEARTSRSTRISLVSAKFLSRSMASAFGISTTASQSRNTSRTAT